MQHPLFCDRDTVREAIEGKFVCLVGNVTNNKYWRVYLSLMDRAIKRTRHTQIERHHVLPKSLGGTDFYVVSLTYREHFMAHRLLTKFTKGQARRKMCYALWSMVRVKPGVNRPATSKQYEIAKRAYREAITGRPVNAETRARISASKRNPSNETRRRLSLVQSNRSPEWRAKIASANRGRIVTDKARANMRLAGLRRSSRPEHSRALIGHTVTEETRQKMSASRKLYWQRWKEANAAKC